MIQGRRLLTNAHCVEHHTQVSVGIPPCDSAFMHAVSALDDDHDHHHHDVAVFGLCNFFSLYRLR